MILVLDMTMFELALDFFGRKRKSEAKETPFLCPFHTIFMSCDYFYRYSVCACMQLKSEKMPFFKCLALNFVLNG